MDKTVLLCGPFPKPIGGISVHIERLSHFLNENSYKVIYCDESPAIKRGAFNIRSVNIFQYIKLVSSTKIIHIHSAIHLFRFIHIVFAYVFNKPTVVTLHSWRSGKVTTTIWRFLLKTFPLELIFVSEAIKERFRLPGRVCPAYINPDLNLEDELPEELLIWINKAKTKYQYFAVSNAYRLVRNNNEDLYGLDLCIDAAKNLNNLFFVFVIANPECAKEKIKMYRKEIDQAGMDDRFLIHEGSLSFIKLLEIADISVRATNTDGDALSVRESLYFGCKTIASDASVRPNGVIKFANRRSDDLANKLLFIINDNSIDSGKYLTKDCTTEIVELYESVLL